MLNYISQIVSKIFSPILVFCYTIILYVYTFSASYESVLGAMIIFVQTVLFVYVFSRFILRLELNGLLETNKLMHRIPVYMLCSFGLCLSLLWCYLLNIDMYKKLILSGILTTSISALITIFWKISAHTSVFSGIAGLLVITSNPENIIILLALLALTAIGFSRVYLREHTISQVVAGAFLGTCISYFTNIIFSV